MKCTIGTASPPGPGHDSPSPNTLKSSITASVYIPPSATAPLSKPSPTADSAPPPDQHTNETLSKNLDTAHCGAGDTTAPTNSAWATPPNAPAPPRWVAPAGSGS